LGQLRKEVARFSTPVIVRVQLPSEAIGLLYWPRDIRCYMKGPPKRGSGQARTALECAQLLPRKRQAAPGTPEEETAAAAIGR